MKKLMVVALFCGLILAFTSCEKNKMNMTQAIEIYGNDYYVIDIDNKNFMIKWENATMIFNNNECVQVVKVK